MHDFILEYDAMSVDHVCSFTTVLDGCPWAIPCQEFLNLEMKFIHSYMMQIIPSEMYTDEDL